LREGAGQRLDQRVVAVLLDIAEEAGHRPFGSGGDAAELVTAASDCHESGAHTSELTPGVRRLIASGAHSAD